MRYVASGKLQSSEAGATGVKRLEKKAEHLKKRKILLHYYYIIIIIAEKLKTHNAKANIIEESSLGIGGFF